MKPNFLQHILPTLATYFPGVTIHFADDFLFYSDAFAKSSALKWRVLLLENLRFTQEEERAIGICSETQRNMETLISMMPSILYKEHASTATIAKYFTLTTKVSGT
ncbi:MAG: phosphoglycerate kinase [Saprospiraceae bacterium]|nr:phosphoglycerate kinase [Saprospiraceae bacterium]